MTGSVLLWYYTIMALVILLLMAFISWWGYLSVRWYRATVGDRIIGASVLTVGQLCAIGYGLGSIGWFREGWITFLNVAVSLMVWCGRDGFAHPGAVLWRDMRLAGVRLWEALKNPVTGLMACLVAVELAVLVWFAISMPPMSYDGWGYHTVKAVLMNMTGWIQPWRWTGTEYAHGFEGYRDIVEQRAGFTDFYPANGSVIMAYILMYTHSIRLSCLAQMPFALLAALSVWRIVRGVVGASTETAAICAGAVMVNWTVMGQAWYAIADLMAFGLLAAGYAMATCGDSSSRRAPGLRLGRCGLQVPLAVILSALAVGLAVGTKIAAGYWGLGVLGLVIYQSFGGYKCRLNSTRS